MDKYKGKIIELMYSLPIADPSPIIKGELEKKFSPAEHMLFASGADVVWISENLFNNLRGYWEKRRDLSKIYNNRPVRVLTYAQTDLIGIPRITRASLLETSTAVRKTQGWSNQSLEVARNY